ncbi:hypothetical protein B0G57_14114 [Trinickia symbiotica]|uniref:JAB domain-containing protein n=1 Tax=Trinickia symbiotica TaxID=863227 RepID=A0A2N7WKC3_9BURK|nr:Mov34/MPN/PAD-1 family protein [Trinickia symbiotica]PMS29880.1 hypothetical protein C0Z20_30455 [Trinickia symbiotica]PPK41086.1 hypothetical protein B0G57_14114 [Trinickia symbiotica]
MTISLRFPAGAFEELRAHLLPVPARHEQAAFLVVKAQTSGDMHDLELIEMIKLAESDFERQQSDYLELADNARARIIKHAHDLKGSLVEVHSHPAPWPAMFSRADMEGLAETVPHMLWRLPKRPYAAIVVAPSGFDALVWTDSPHRSHALDRVFAGDRILTPTNHTTRALHGQPR